MQRGVAAFGALLFIATALASAPPATESPLGKHEAAQSTSALVTAPQTNIRQLIAGGVPITAEIRFTPVSDYPGGSYVAEYTTANISGQTLTLPEGGVRTYCNTQLLGWGPTGLKLRSWGGRIDAQGFLGANADCGSGPGSCTGAGDLYGAQQSCNNPNDCEAAFGEGPSFCSSGVCEWGFMNLSRPDSVTPPGFFQPPGCGLTNPDGTLTMTRRRADEAQTEGVDVWQQ